MKQPLSSQAIEARINQCEEDMKYFDERRDWANSNTMEKHAAGLLEKLRLARIEEKLDQVLSILTK